MLRAKWKEVEFRSQLWMNHRCLSLLVFSLKCRSRRVSGPTLYLDIGRNWAECSSFSWNAFVKAFSACVIVQVKRMYALTRIRLIC